MVDEVAPPTPGGILFQTEACQIQTKTGAIHIVTIVDSITGATMLRIVTFIRAALIWIQFRIETPPIRLDEITPLRIVDRVLRLLLFRLDRTQRQDAPIPSL
jgi:hypothetical protein